jgi:ABC-type bacteriocin/lantibiotic exporter with double-glycine peptidase domain
MLTVIRKILDLLSIKERKNLYFLWTVLVIMAFIEMAGIASIMPFMSVVANPEVVETNSWMKQVYEFFRFTSVANFLFFLGLSLLVLTVFSNLLKALTAWWVLRYDNQLNYMLAWRLLAQYMSRPYSFFLDRNTAEMGKNILTEVRTVISGVLSAGMSVLSSTLISLCILILLLLVDPFIAVTVAATLGSAYAGLYLLVRRRLAKISKDNVQVNFMKFKIASEALSGIKDLKILGREEVFLGQFAIHAQRHALNNVAWGIISQLPRYALEVMAFGSILLIVMYFESKQGSSSQMIPLLSLYAFAGYRLLPSVQQIFSGITTVRTNLAALEILHRDLAEGQADRNLERVLAKQNHLQPLPFTRGLELRNVSFCYSGVQVPAIEAISLTIARNTSIGIVGATGSGKTTTVDLILGLLTPTLGQLLVDDVEVDGNNMASWRLNLGYVPQSIFLCDDTITRNIAFGVPEQEIDMAAVVRTARIANLHEFIERELPNGFETVIGERGVRLSGGQRQRIGIARALYRDPAVLIMDEATSALDGVTEHAVMEALHTLSGKKTIIMIAHRLTTVKDCDVIYLMENGRIVGQGTYDNLLRSSVWFKAAAKTGT